MDITLFLFAGVVIGFVMWLLLTQGGDDPFA